MDLVPTIIPGQQLGGLDNTLTVGSVVVATPLGQVPRAYLVKSADRQIAILDTQTPTEISFRYSCHSYTGQAQDREQVKKIIRVKLYGDGVVSPDAPAVPDDRVPSMPSGLMTITADGLRTDTYLYSAQASEPWNGILWAQQAFALSGRSFDIDIFLRGTGLKIRECALEYIISN